MAFLKLKHLKAERLPSPASGPQLLNIPEGAVFNGDVTAAGSARVDGELYGNLTAGGSLVVGTSCVIKGDVKAGDVNIAGRITGNLFSDGSVRIGSQGVLKGNVVAKGLIAEQGSTFSGHCEIGGQDSGAKRANEDAKRVNEDARRVHEDAGRIQPKG